MDKREILLLAGLLLCFVVMLGLVYQLAGTEALMQVLDGISESLADEGY